MAELARLVEEGPNIEVHRVVRWRCIDLQIKARFDVELSERQVSFLGASVGAASPSAD